jgi:hypothetical protein
MSSLQRGLTPSKGLARFHNRAKGALAVRQKDPIFCRLLTIAELHERKRNSEQACRVIHLRFHVCELDIASLFSLGKIFSTRLKIQSCKLCSG